MKIYKGNILTVDSKDSVKKFLVEDGGRIVFTGDTLLQDYPVILKFPGGNQADYERAALPYLQALDPESIILPGHGDPFVLKDRKIADYV